MFYLFIYTLITSTHCQDRRTFFFCISLPLATYFSLFVYTVLATDTQITTCTYGSQFLHGMANGSFAVILGSLDALFQYVHVKPQTSVLFSVLRKEDTDKCPT